MKHTAMATKAELNERMDKIEQLIKHLSSQINKVLESQQQQLSLQRGKGDCS